MLAICFVLATVFYWLLLAVPTIIRNPPNVTFMCDGAGGFVLQERCGADRICYDWNSNKRGFLYVNHCRFTCKSGLEPGGYATTIDPELESSSTSEENYFVQEDDYDEHDIIDEEAELQDRENKNTDEPTPHPHLCYKNTQGVDICEVYTKYSKPITLDINLLPSIDNIVEENSNLEELKECHYGLGSNFHCRINPDVIQNLTKVSNSCEPIVQCNLFDPYTIGDSILRVSECGYNNISFWLYLVIRSLADIFPTAAVALLGGAIVIATRETSTGRGDVGKQFAFGALGLAVFAPIVGAIGSYLAALIIFTVLMILAALIVILDGKMPLSPPEWWWHTRCGLVAYPMSAVRKYGMETIALTLVLLVLGIFWSVLDSLLPWRLLGNQNHTLLLGLAITIGALPAIPILVFAERVVDYIGHANVLISTFTLYILHFTGSAYMESAGLLLLCEAIEILSLHIMWITTVLYFRHLIPRRFTVCGQAIPVIVHFCLGRAIGISFYSVSGDYVDIHRGFAIAAAVIAIVYFLVYHFYLKPKYAAPVVSVPPRPTPSIVQNMNGNGSYTPLRVYHNGRAKKGQFRY